MERAKKFLKSQIKFFAIAFLKQFAVPIVLVSLIIMLCSFFTDILDFGYSNKDKIDMKKELAYYKDTSDYSDDEMKSFLDSAWEFVSGLLGFGDLKWPLPEHYEISSNYGPRTHPVTRKDR